MKTLITILAIFLISGVAYAAPRLVTDPVDPATCGGTDQPTCPTKAVIYQETATSINPIVWGSQTELATDVPLEVDMSLNYDLAGVAPGVHRFTATYLDDTGGVSVPSNPTILGPDSPKGTRVSQ